MLCPGDLHPSFDALLQIEFDDYVLIDKHCQFVFMQELINRKSREKLERTAALLGACIIVLLTDILNTSVY